jgi:hypothetical protein
VGNYKGTRAVAVVFGGNDFDRAVRTDMQNAQIFGIDGRRNRNSDGNRLL